MLVALALVLPLALHCDGWGGSDFFQNASKAPLRDARINTRMALFINNTLTEMRVAAGEPIVFSYQPQDTSGNPEILDGRAFVWSIYDDTRTNHGQFSAIVKTGSNPRALWKLTGTVSEGLLGKPNLKWEIAERLDDGRDIIASGNLTVNVSAPAVLDYDNAPISRYIAQIVRLNDQTTKDAPVFRVQPALYTEAPPPPVFSVLPTISPSVAQIGATYSANDGTANNTKHVTRRWLMNGTAIATGSTVIPVSTGNLVLEVTAAGVGGTTVTTSSAAIVAAKLTITGTPARATQNVAYSFTPTTTGGSGTKTFALSGTLPAGLSFSTLTGAITGTPTTITTLSVSITVTDASGSATLANVTVAVDAPLTFTTLAAPAALSTPPSFTIQRGSDGSYRHDFNATTRRFTTNLTYYAGAGGSDSNDGLTWATRYRSLTKLLAAARARAGSAGATQLYAQTGVYRKSDATGFVLGNGVAQSIANNMRFNLEPCDGSGNPITVNPATVKTSKNDQIIVYHDQVMPSFVATSDPRIFVSTYTTETPGKAVFDEKYTNRFGRPLGLMNVPGDQVADVTNPIAEINKMAESYIEWGKINATWGTETKKGAFFLDRTNKKLWVRLSDDRAPDSQMVVTASSNVWYMAVGQNSLETGHYVRGVDFMGGTVRENGWPASSLWTRTFIDNYFGSAQEGAYLSSSAGSVVWQRCYGSDIGVDFIGSGTESGETANIVGYELDCSVDFVGRNGPNGNGGGGDTSSNAYTEHSRSRVTRVNLEYRFFHNRGIHDIGDAQVWMCGTKAGPSTSYSDAVSGFVNVLSNDQKNMSVAVACGYHQTTDPQTTLTYVDGLTTVGPMNYSMAAYNNKTDSTTGGALFYRNVTNGAINLYTIDHPATGNGAKGKISTY